MRVVEVAGEGVNSALLEHCLALQNTPYHREEVDLLEYSNTFNSDNHHKVLHAAQVLDGVLQ